MPSKAPAKIKWPVEEMGRNSVSPSTTPMTAALNSNKKSKVYPLSNARIIAAHLHLETGATAHATQNLV
jgi:hypothetical protein